MIGVTSNIFQIVVFASRSDAFLGIASSFQRSQGTVGIDLSQEDGFELIHSGVGKKQSRVVQWGTCRTWLHGMPSFFKEFDKGRTNFVSWPIFACFRRGETGKRLSTNIAGLLAGRLVTDSLHHRQEKLLSRCERPHGGRNRHKQHYDRQPGAASGTHIFELSRVGTTSASLRDAFQEDSETVQSTKLSLNRSLYGGVAIENLDSMGRCE